METSAIYILSSLYGIQAASIHIVSDNSVMNKSFFDKTSVEENEKREKCSDLLLDVLVKLVARARGYKSLDNALLQIIEEAKERG